MDSIPGGIVAPDGFRTVSVHTGVQGRLDAEAVDAQTARALNLPPRRVFCASTRIIGQRLPTEKVLPGICAASRLHRGHCDDAMEGIMTTDTFPKQIAVEFEVDGKQVRLGGVAKGSGMIEPNVATMLGFVTTDAAIDQPVLQNMLRRVCADTLNAISVDGDTSTNDMVLVLANGLAGNKRITDPQSAGAKQSKRGSQTV